MSILRSCAAIGLVLRLKARVWVFLEQHGTGTARAACWEAKEIRTGRELGLLGRSRLALATARVGKSLRVCSALQQTRSSPLRAVAEMLQEIFKRPVLQRWHR